MKKIPLADYLEHREAFRAFVAPDGDSRILLFSGQSGSGKTTLLGACLQEIPKHVTTVPIQMRGSATTVSEILRRVGDRRGWPAMPNFIDALQALPQVQVDANKLVGVGNQINVALNVPPADRAQRRAALTEAWFADLRALDRPYLLAIDTYEDAIPDVQEWLAGPFLARAVTTPTLRVLIAGQTVPDTNNIEWGHCCAHHELFGVREAAHWLPVVEAMGRYIPVEDPLIWLSGVCYALKGAPKDIVQVIESLPCKEVAA